MVESVVSRWESDSEISSWRRRASEERSTPAEAGVARLGVKFAHYAARRSAKAAPLVVGLASLALLGFAWMNGHDAGLEPDTGVGYWLGIVGSCAMLALLIYPLRKRMRSLSGLGTIAFWFRAHMFLGIVGPVLVIIHSDFKFGSLNSNVALIAMLLVAASGMVGRYLYSQIHLGLYGRKAQVRDILKDAEALKEVVGEHLPLADRVIEQMNDFTTLVMAPSNGVFGSLLSVPRLALLTRRARARLLAETRRVITAEGKRHAWPRRAQRLQIAAVANLVDLHLAAVRKAAAFAFYERLFALWHVLHLPLFVLLVIAAVIHVFAAHFY